MPERPTTFLQCLNDHPTASAALDAWCRMRFGDGTGPLEVSVLDDRKTTAKEPLPFDREPDTAIRYRRVALHWAGIPVSEATNWYYPDRLPSGIAHDLLTTSIPFGALLQGFAPRRDLIQIRTLDLPDFALEVHAALSLPGGPTIAIVNERYHRSLLG